MDMLATYQSFAAIEAPQLPPNPGYTIGALLMGFPIDMILLGIMSYQTVLWASDLRKERWVIRILVVISVLLGIATSVYGIWMAWGLFAADFGTLSSLSRAGRVTNYVVMNGIAIFIVQLFYLDRAYTLFNRKLWVPIVLGPFIIGAFVSAILLASIQLDPKRKTVGGDGRHLFSWLGVTLAADLLLTGVIMYALSQRRTGWTKTDQLVNRLMRASVETQLPATVTTVALLVTFSVSKASPLLILFEVIFAKLYIVPMLAVLNYRFTLRLVAGSSADQGDEDARKHSVFAMSRRRQGGSRVDASPLGIHVETHRHEESHQVAQPQSSKGRLPAVDEADSAESAGDEFSSQVRLTRFTRENSTSKD